MTAKPIPIIDSPMEAGDQAVRDDLYAALVATTIAIDGKIAALEHQLDMRIEELTLRVLELEEGYPPKLSD